MSVSTLFIRQIGACLLGLVICGCQDGRTLPSGTESAAPPELPSEAPGAAPSSVQAEAKPIPPLSISVEILGEPQVGRALELRVITRSPVVLNEVSVEVQGDERILVTPATASWRVARVARDEAMVRLVTVTPLVDGALHVSILVQAEINGRVQARHRLFPIQVGPVSAPATADRLDVDASGELIIALPAQESR